MTPIRNSLDKVISNVFAGLFGGDPGAGATMRTVVNISTGGQKGV
jgi:sulfate permease, SulP family